MGDSLRRLDDLLLEEATTGLGAADRAELERLLAEHPEVDRHVFEHAAAAICLASLDTSAPLPASLRSRLERQAIAFLGSETAERR